MTTASSYVLMHCVLESISEPNKKPLDISPLIPSFEIEESIYSDCIKGSAFVIDLTGVLEGYPLRGEERLTLRVKDAGDLEREYNMFLYKVDNIAINENGEGVSYVIYFTSYQRWISDRKRVIRSYDNTAHEIALDIYKNFYDSSPVVESKDIIVDNTLEEDIRIVVPNYAPHRAMQFVAERSHSLTSRSCSYRFFESADAFFFVSDEYLYKLAFEKGRIYEFTHAQFERSMETLNQQMNNLTTLRTSKKVNSIMDQINGAYASRSYIMDLNFGLYEEMDFRYEDQLFFGEGDDRHTVDFRTSQYSPDNGLSFYVIRNYDQTSYGSVASDQFYPEILQNRASYRSHLSALTLTATSAGRLDITCGDIMKVTVGDFSNSSETVRKKGNLSGEYIVASVKKSFDKENSTNIYQLVKCGWGDVDRSLTAAPTTTTADTTTPVDQTTTPPTEPVEPTTPTTPTEPQPPATETA